MPIHDPLINAPSFVIQRRIPCTLAAVHTGLADRTPLAPPELVMLDPDGYADLAEPFRPTAPRSGRQPSPSWCAPASLLTARGRVVATVDIEVSMWSHGSTELQLRPVARHPERWSGRRMRRYFALAHLTADEAERLLARRVHAARELIEISAARVDADPGRFVALRPKPSGEQGRAQSPRVGSRTTARSRTDPTPRPVA